MTRRNLTCILFILLGVLSELQTQSTHTLDYTIRVDQSLISDIKGEGRLYVFLSKNPRGELRRRTWPSPGGSTSIYARNYTNHDWLTPIRIEDSEAWMSTSDMDLNAIESGTYYIQALWDQDFVESRINAPGNFYSEVKTIEINSDSSTELVLDQVIGERDEPEHELVRWIHMKSDTLTEWWGKDMYLKASVLLPSEYDSSKVYPIRYNVAGYGGRYTRVTRLLRSTSFMDWWTSDEAPEIINVFLDGEGPFGDSYQMDSENNGPYGHALINELIPFIENLYRGSTDPSQRFVDGCSTGGWVSLGLQLYYPDQFNGVFSYSPDAIEFENYQLVNIYKDNNVFVNEYGYKRPVWRETSGEPVMSLEEFVKYENVLGYSDTYVTSGGQLGAHTALYSPKSEVGLPTPLFDPQSGEIDREVADHWKKYDFKIYASENWSELGPAIAGKVYIWMGDMDNFYLNTATRAFADFLESTENPKSDAVIEFSATEGHCTQFSNRVVLEQIEQRLDTMKN